VFSFNGKFYKQVDGYSIGNPLSPTLANIFICKLEEDVVTPHNFPFYDWYVDDCFTKRKTNAPNNLLEKLNNYHPIIKFTVEENPDHFLDTSQPSRMELHHQRRDIGTILPKVYVQKLNS